MGRALGAALLASPAYRIVVSDILPVTMTHPRLSVGSIPDVLASSSVVFLGIKPQSLADAAPTIAPHLTPNHVVVSMLAGTPIRTLIHHLGTPSMIRIMPNTPAGLGQGVTGVYVPPHGVSDDQTKATLAICEGFGTCHVVPNESDLHVITALSGSGPAFFYATIQSFVRFATEQGMAPHTAVAMATQTMLGAGAMLQTTPDPTALIQMVTSPNGTTEAGLKAMAHHKLDEDWQAVLTATWSRSVELSKEAHHDTTY